MGQKKLTRFALVAALGLAGSSFGQNIATWDIDTTDLDAGTFDASYTLNAGSLDANLATATLTLGNGVNPSTTAGQYGFKVAGGDEQTTLAGAITANHYIEFSFVAASGHELNLDTLFLLGQSSGTGANNVAFMTSVDGFSAGNELHTLAGIAGSTGGFDTDSSGFGDGTISLTDAKYQGISQISFRIYGWNTSGGAGVTHLRSLSGDDVILSGSAAAVPEPGSFALIAGCLGLSLVMLKRRRA